jgi:hypothetical protein
VSALAPAAEVIDVYGVDTALISELRGLHG